MANLELFEGEHDSGSQQCEVKPWEGINVTLDYLPIKKQGALSNSPKAKAMFHAYRNQLENTMEAYTDC